MSTIRELYNEAIISDEQGAHYSNLNDAVTNETVAKTFVINKADSLTANLTIPEDYTIIINQVGSLGGAYTLTGNSTSLILIGDESLSTDVSFAGSFIMDKVTPEMFSGTVANRLNKSNQLCALTDSKVWSFKNGETYDDTSTTQYQCPNFIIEGNFATIKKPQGFPIVAQGTEGTFYNLSENAYRGDSWVRCSNTTLLNSLSAGDVVKILSDEIVQPTVGENSKFGEMHMVRSVDVGNEVIYFNEYMKWNYATSDTARVAKIDVINFAAYNLKIDITSTIDTSVGFTISKAFTKIENCFVRALTYGCQLSDCYKPKISIHTTGSDKEGIGYGVTTAEACMYGDIQIFAAGARHAFTSTGGDGISWDINVHDSIGIASTIVSGGMFDTHASSGSVSFRDCLAVGGIDNANYDSISEWDNSTTWNVGDLVRSTTKKYLAKALQSNSNSDPDDFANIDDWQDAPERRDSAVGFKAEGLYNYFFDCVSIDVKFGIYINSEDGKKTVVSNCKAQNVEYGIATTTGFVEDLSIDGMETINDHYMSVAYGLYILCGVTNYCIRNIRSKNVIGLTFSPASDIETLRIDGFSFINDVEKIGISAKQSFENVFISNGETKNAKLFSNVYSASYPATRVIAFSNILTRDNYDDIITIGHDVEDVVLNNVMSIDPTAGDYLVNIDRGADRLQLNGVLHKGTGATKAVYSESTLTDIIATGCSFPNVTNFREGTGALAANLLTNKGVS